MKKRILAFLLCFAMAASLMSVTAFACSNDVTYSSPLTGTINGYGVNLRLGHSTSATIRASLDWYDTMSITKYYNGSDYTWFYGTVTYCSKSQNIGLKGWIAGGYGGFITVV